MTGDAKTCGDDKCEKLEALRVHVARALDSGPSELHAFDRMSVLAVLLGQIAAGLEVAGGRRDDIEAVLVRALASGRRSVISNPLATRQPKGSA